VAAKNRIFAHWQSAELRKRFYLKQIVENYYKNNNNKKCFKLRLYYFWTEFYILFYFIVCQAIAYAYVPLGSGILVLRMNLGSSQFHPVLCVGQYRSIMAVSLRRANFRNTNSWPTVSDPTICPAKAFGRCLVFWKLCHRTTDPL